MNILAPLPIGNSFFDSIIENDYYYIDKTLFVKDILDRKTAVTLCTRPRRFGKTLSQTMLKCFFEDTAPFGGKDTRTLFNGLKIESAGDQYMEHQGKYPVIFLSFKDAKHSTFEASYNSLKKNLVDEFHRHRFILSKISGTNNKALFEKLESGEGTREEYALSLKFLCQCLENYHGKKTIILIDEYDVPLENAWVENFYDEMIKFIRPLLGLALKDNPHLMFSVITGCLRISKESIFTGLNNLDTVSILSPHYDEYFGFTQDEMDAILKFYGLESKGEILRDWYNGYLFGNTIVYNPWSAVKIVSDWRKEINQFPLPHWANTSSNDIVKKLIIRADNEIKLELDTLISGGTITKLIHEDITYDELEEKTDNLWNFLFFTGYLTSVGKSLDNIGRISIEMKIPNKEVNIIYVNKIQEWFDKRIAKKNLDTLFNAILNKDVATFQSELSALLAESISFMDCAENFYHGFMTGILSRLDGYLAKSNRESGNGRSDIVLYAVTRRGKAIIFELKPAKKFKDLPAVCAEALKQIEINKYADYWIDDGYNDIIKYAIAFNKKDCRVEVAT
jgi:hypothetical protein